MDPDDYGKTTLCFLHPDKNNSKAKEFFKCVPKIEEYGNNKFSLKYMNESQQFILRFTLMEVKIIRTKMRLKQKL